MYDCFINNHAYQIRDNVVVVAAKFAGAENNWFGFYEYNHRKVSFEEVARTQFKFTNKKVRRAETFTV